MEVSGKTIGSASSSRFARLSVNKDAENQEVVVCKKSFFSWAVHAMRYRFSSSYREREHELRASILASLREQGSDTTATLNAPDDAPGDAPLGNRREFNAYLIKYLNLNSGSAENSTTVLQGEIRVLEGSVTPGNNKVPALDVEAKEAAGKEQGWPRGGDVYFSFWKKKEGSDIVKNGHENVFRFESGGDGSAEPVALRSESLLRIKVTNEISKKFGDGGPSIYPSGVTCALGHILFTTPKGEQEGLFSHSARIGNRDYGAWGFLGDHMEEGHCAHCRLPNERLHGAVNGLFMQHFTPGQSKENILKGLNQDREKAGNPDHRGIFKPWSVRNSLPLTEAEFRFCLDAMENFANAYFDANS